MEDIQNANHTEMLAALNEKIKGIRMAMLTTLSPDGLLHSRPMATQEVDAQGKLWFLTGLNSSKAGELEQNSHVNLTYADEGKNTFVSISGKGFISKDFEKAKELWNPLYKAWFPNGLDDDNLGVLRIDVDFAEYWNDNSNRMVQLFKMVRAALGGADYTADHGEIHLID